MVSRRSSPVTRGGWAGGLRVDRLAGALNRDQYGDLSTGADQVSGTTIFISGAVVGGVIQFFRGERRWVRVAPAN